jgi:hypothetical protein
MSFDSKVLYNQLGGGKLQLMLGAHSFVCSEADRYLMFKFKVKALNGINTIKATLDIETDTYSLEFYKVRGINTTLFKSYVLLHSDQLQPLIESTTGADICNVPRIIPL